MVEVIGTIINIVLIVCSAGLIAVVLMQQSKSGGLGGAFGGDTQSFTPARGRAASKEAKLQKLTIILSAVIGALTLAMIFFVKK